MAKYLASPLDFFFHGFLTSLTATRLSHGQVPRLMSDNLSCCETEIKQENHNFCVRRSHFTDSDLSSRERCSKQGSNPQSPDQLSYLAPKSPGPEGKYATIKDRIERGLRLNLTLGLQMPKPRWRGSSVDRARDTCTGDHGFAHSIPVGLM